MADEESRARTVRLLRAYHERFEGEPLIVRAPGRVNLIGEHTDYNEGYVLPIAIAHDVRFAVRRRPDRHVRLYSLDFDAETRFDLDPIERDPAQEWGNYVRGIAVELLREGVRLHGMEGVVQGNVPIASGLSSSAAMEVAAGLAFCVTSQAVVEPPCLAELAQRAENHYMGVRVGIMDPFISCMGHPGHALFLDCRSLAYELIPVPGDKYLFIATDSRYSRELAASAYNERRAQCEDAVAVLSRVVPNVRALRDVSPADLERHRDLLPETVYRRARHVVSENERVLQAVAALRAGDLAALGRLMNASHESLRDDYQVSSGPLDCLVTAARAVEGCLGSRLTGAGFGGCTVSLIRADRVGAFRDQVSAAYQRHCGQTPEFHVTRPAAGAGLVDAAA